MTVHVHRCSDFDNCYHPRTGDVELIEMVARGMHTPQIAGQSGRARQSVKNRVAGLCEILGAHNRPSLVRRAFELGLLTTRHARPYIGRYHHVPLDAAVIEKVSRGLQDKQIAEADHRSTQTIKNRLANLYKEWNVSDRASLVRRAIELGVLTIQKDGLD